jgi:two-component system, LytTR family, response regulator
MRSLIIDDEASARSRLARLLEKHSEVEVIGEAADGLEAVQKIEQLRPDLIFLDIEMPGLTGFEVLQSVSGVPLPLVIFVTGYDHHALAAFQANALAYLLKPVEPDRLAQSIERAARLKSFAAEKEHERQNVLRVARESPKVLRRIVCRKRDSIVLVPPEQIFWFRIEDRVVKAKTATDVFWVNYRLSELETDLPKELFFRARREVLVNLSKIKEMKPFFKSGFLLIMTDSAATEIAVSERQVSSLRERMPGL